MDYLLSPIRRELEERVAENVDSGSDVLVFDFIDSDLLANADFKTEYHSLISLLSNGTSLSQFPEAAYDCIVCNLEAAWIPIELLVEDFRRILKTNGQLYFASFGPDTLAEVAQAWSAVDHYPHVHEFIDMHHLGDMLLKSGFSRPILDVDWHFIEFPGVEALMHDLKESGFQNILHNRRKTLTGKNRFKKFCDELDAISASSSENVISFEIVYGYARKPEDQDGTVRVRPPALDFKTG